MFLEPQAFPFWAMAPGAARFGLTMSNQAGFDLFSFVWLATLGLPELASRTAAGPFRCVVEAPYSVSQLRDG